MVAINKEKLIGIMSLNSRPFLTSKKTFKGAELSVWLIEKSYQGKGIGAKILQKITSSYDFLVGVSITNLLYLFIREWVTYTINIFQEFLGLILI